MRPTLERSQRAQPFIHIEHIESYHIGSIQLLRQYHTIWISFMTQAQLVCNKITLSPRSFTGSPTRWSMWATLWWPSNRIWSFHCFVERWISWKKQLPKLSCAGSLSPRDSGKCCSFRTVETTRFLISSDAHVSEMDRPKVNTRFEAEKTSTSSDTRLLCGSFVWIDADCHRHVMNSTHLWDLG